MTVPIVCPECGAAYASIKLPAGSTFACGECTHELHVPDGARSEASDALPVVQPTRPASPLPVVAPSAGPPPVVQPKAGKPPVVQPKAGKPPVVQPKAGKPPVVQPKAGKPPVVQPKAGKPPVVQPAPQTGSDAAPAPMVQPTPRSKAGKKPGRRPASAPAKGPAGRRAPTRAPKGRAGQVTAAPKPGTAPAPGSAPRPARGTKTRPHTRVVREQDIGGAPEKNSKTPLILASVFGTVCVAVLIIAIVSMSGGDSGMEERESYIAGYELGAHNHILSAFQIAPQSSDAGFKTFKAGFEGAKPLEFQKGATDGKNGAKPTHGGEEVKGSRYDIALIRDAINRLGNRNGALDGSAVWRTAETVENVMRKWSSSAPSGVTSELKTTHKNLLKKVIELDPDHAEARTARGEMKYEDQLLKYIEASWLMEGDKKVAKSTHNRLKRAAEKNGGWIPNADKTKIETVTAKFAEKEKKHRAFVEGPFYSKAMAMKDEVADDLKMALQNAKDNFGKLEEAINKAEGIPEAAKKQILDNMRRSMTEGVDDREYQAILDYPPYVLFVEKNDQWDPHLVGKQVLGPLSSLNEIFLDKYAKKFELADNQEPIPVVYFRTADAYQQYRWGKFGAQPNNSILAHFEHDKGRLVIHDETDKGTILHEGTHQLFWYHAKVKSDFADQSYWFQEGVAEWFSGHRRFTVGEKWHYELGLLQRDRIFGARMLIGRGDIYALEDLINFTYGDRAKKGTNHGLIYAQGWMLIYFLNYFDVDEDGIVKVDTPDKPVTGRYREVWEKMLRYVMVGKDGKPHTGKNAFLDAAGASSVDELAEMGDLFDRYQRWLAHKIKFKHTKNKRIVPWNKYRNRQGKNTAVKEDDAFPKTRERQRLKDKKDAEDKDGEGNG